MAMRFVVVGWPADDFALRVTGLEADLLVRDKLCRVQFSVRADHLSDAVVLVPHRDALGEAYENASAKQFRRVMDRIKLLCPRATTVVMSERARAAVSRSGAAKGVTVDLDNPGHPRRVEPAGHGGSVAPGVARADASFVLDWLRQSGAPENIVGLQERAVEALGGFVSWRGRVGA